MYVCMYVFFSARPVYRQKQQNVGYIFAADIMRISVYFKRIMP